MKQTRIGLQLSVEIHKANIAKSDFAAQCGLSNAMISRILYDANMRIGPGTIKKLCKGMQKHGADIHLLIAHLRDEIHRAGYVPEKTIELKDITKIEKPERKIILDNFQELAMQNDELFCIITEMLTFIAKTKSYPSLPGNAPDIAAIE